MTQRCPNPYCGVEVTSDKCWNCGQVCATIDPITKLRRRVEDVLRKSTPEKVKEVAQMLGVR